MLQYCTQVSYKVIQSRDAHWHGEGVPEVEHFTFEPTCHVEYTNRLGAVRPLCGSQENPLAPGSIVPATG